MSQLRIYVMTQRTFSVRAGHVVLRWVKELQRGCSGEL